MAAGTRMNDVIPDAGAMHPHCFASPNACAKVALCAGSLSADAPKVLAGHWTCPEEALCMMCTGSHGWGKGNHDVKTIHDLAP